MISSPYPFPSGALRLGALCLALGTIFVHDAVQTAQAACTSGTECVVDNATETLTTGDTYTRSTNNGYALRVRNGGSATGDNLTLNDTTSKDGPVVRADSGGTITLNNATITGNNKENGIYATGSGSSITMSGGSISNVKKYAVELGQGTSITFTGNVDVSGKEKIVDVGKNATFTMTGGTLTSEKGSVTTDENATVTLSNVTVNNTNDKTAIDIDKKSTLTMTGGSVTSAREGVQLDKDTTATIDGTSFSTGRTAVESRGALTMNNLDITVTGSSSGYRGVYVRDGNATLTHGSITSVGTGIYARKTTSLAASDIAINTSGNFADAVYLENVDGAGLNSMDITTTGSSARGIYVDAASKNVTLTDNTVTTQGQNSHALWVDEGTDVTLTGDTLTVNGTNASAISLDTAKNIHIAGATLNANGINSEAVYSGKSQNVEISNTTINASGTGAWGVVVWNHSNAFKLKQVTLNSAAGAAGGIQMLDGSVVEVSSNSTINATDGAAVYARGSGVNQFAVLNSALSGDRLVFADETGASLNFSAQASQLTGGSLVANAAKLTMDLSQGSTWTVRPANALTGSSNITGETLHHSHVSVLNLADSTVRFTTPTGSNYQTLHIGSGAPGTSAVYNASGNARLELNTLLNDGGALSDQSTDRVLIHGDVAGTTLIKVHPMAGSPGANTSPSGLYLNSEGISLVQVSGNASESSFALEGGYATVGGQPWQYTLYAYGNGSSHGAPDDAQRLVDGSGDWWDYRLQSATAPASGGGRVRVPVPQVSNYVLAPVALLHSASVDMAALHTHLGEIRATSLAGGRSPLVAFSSQQAAPRFYDPYGVYRDYQVHNAALSVGGSVDRSPARREVFVRAVGGRYNYASNLADHAYGYDARLRSSGVQFGGSLYVLEGASSDTRFGLAANYGTTSFTPKNVPNTRKTHIHRWTVAPYISYQHHSGVYVDALLALGKFSGDVNTGLRGQTAKLKGNSIDVSIAAGVPFDLNDGGLSLVPQVQLGWQHLKFKPVRDVDNFDVHLGKVDQFTGALGAQLQQALGAGGSSVYARVMVEQAWRNSKQVWLGDDFHLGKSGSHLKSTVGVNANASDALQIYGEATYKNRLASAGVRGTSVAVGLRYQF